MASFCRLTSAQVASNADTGSNEIFDLRDRVAVFRRSDVARVIVDVNRSADDRRPSGVLKTQTCWGVPVYRQPLPAHVQQSLLEKYYHPYHARLTEGGRLGLLMGVDCHTMAAIGPPFAPDAGHPRPIVCLSDKRGITLPPDWIDRLAECFEQAFAGPVGVNSPLSGGFTIKMHAAEMPWVQIEISRMSMPDSEKRRRLLSALGTFCV